MPLHGDSRIRASLLLAELLGDAFLAAANRTRHAIRTKRRGYTTRRPGGETPLWNAVARALHDAVRPRGAKSRLARHLGVPRQRIYDFLHRRSRMPDAETTLLILHWLTDRNSDL